MTLIERTIAITSKDVDGNTTIDMPITRVENVEGALTEAEIDTKIETALSGSTPEVDTSNLVDLTSGQVITGEKIFNGGLTTSTGLTIAGSSSSDLLTKEITWKAGTTASGSLNHLRYTGNAATATKATQDGNGDVIADTYAKIANTYTREEIDNFLGSNKSFAWTLLGDTIQGFSFVQTIQSSDFPAPIHLINLRILREYLGTPLLIDIFGCNSESSVQRFECYTLHPYNFDPITYNGDGSEVIEAIGSCCSCIQMEGTSCRDEFVHVQIPTECLSTNWIALVAYPTINFNENIYEDYQGVAMKVYHSYVG